MSATSNEKGRELEDAVLVIERAIFAAEGTDAAKTVRIEPRKIVTIAGVREEFDLWVELRGPRGYEAVFIFECKNWSDKVGKPEVVLLSAKIVAARAQRGFLVAPEYTADARAQAALDPRVQLLDVRKEEYDRLRAPMLFPMIQINESHQAAVQLFPPEVGRKRARQIDPTRIKLIEDGQRVSFAEWLARWEAELKEERSNRPDTADLPEGSYMLETSGRRTFAPGTCSFQGARIEAVEVKLTIPTRIERPVFTGSIEVVGRGRVLKLSPFTVAGQTFQLNFVDVPPTEDANEPDAAP